MTKSQPTDYESYISGGEKSKVCIRSDLKIDQPERVTGNKDFLSPVLEWMLHLRDWNKSSTRYKGQTIAVILNRRKSPPKKHGNVVGHYTSGRQAWKIGFLGFFSRIRGLITIGTGPAIFYLAVKCILKLLSSSERPWWWPTVQHVLIFIGIGIFLAIGLLYNRYRTRRSLDIKVDLHALAHFIRDCTVKSRSNASAGQKSSFKVGEVYVEYLTGICNRLQNYYEKVIKTRPIGIIIRLAAFQIDSKTGENLRFIGQ